MMGGRCSWWTMQVELLHHGLTEMGAKDVKKFYFNPRNILEVSEVVIQPKKKTMGTVVKAIMVPQIILVL
jgi:hypothetical protein